MRADPAMDYIVDRITIDPSGCWIWAGAADRPDRYGRAYVHGRNYMAHRLVYELLAGPIPEGLTIDHLCRVRECVNPSHLEPVTMRENVLRGSRGRMVTVCAQGHPYDEANTGRKPDGRRYCRACGRERMSRAREAGYIIPSRRKAA